MSRNVLHKAAMRVAPLAIASFIGGQATLDTAAHAEAGPRILSCKSASAVVKGAGFQSIRTASCSHPYVFLARKRDCSFTINVTADGRWLAVQTGCNASVPEPAGG